MKKYIKTQYGTICIIQLNKNIYNIYLDGEFITEFQTQTEQYPTIEQEILSLLDSRIR